MLHCQKIITQSDVRLWCMSVDGFVTADPIAQLGGKVARRREELGLTQPEVIERMNATPFRPGVSRASHISNIENSDGDKLPSIRSLAALAVALETNMDFLAGLTNDSKPPSDLEDQVVVGVRDDEERALLQELIEIIHAHPREEQRFMADVVRRLAAAPPPKQPVIIGRDLARKR